MLSCYVKWKSSDLRTFYRRTESHRSFTLDHEVLIRVSLKFPNFMQVSFQMT